MKRILRGSRREETERFIAFWSHWGFRAEFYNPAEAHEKRVVEGDGGVLPAEPLGPGAAGPRSGRFERAFAVRLRWRCATRHRATDGTNGRADGAGTRALARLTRGRFRYRGNQLCDRRQRRLCDGAHQSIFDTATAPDTAQWEANFQPDWSQMLRVSPSQVP